MANGLLFFYFFWMVWILVTFFMPESKQRTLAAAFILLCLCFANHDIQLGLSVSITYLILLGGLVFLHVRQSRKVYHFFCVFTLAIGYIAIRLWEVNTPVWLFASREIFISAISVLMTLLLTGKMYDRLICGLLGICIGELVFNGILSYYSFEETIGNMAFLDIVSVMMVLNIVIYFYKQINTKIHSLITQMSHN